jgi:spoIIIJ-associated protein
MYEPSHEWREFVGDSREELVEKAKRFFGVGEDELKFVEIEGGRVSGLGGRVAAIAICKGADRPRPQGRERQGRDREERERGGRERRAGAENRTARRAAGPRAVPREAEVGSTSKVTVKGELTEAGDFVKGVVERMRIGNFEISESEENGELIAVHIRGDAAAQLSGGEARTSDAIQLLANQAAMRLGEGEPKRVVLDVEGEGSAREELLEKVADRAAKRARTTGRPVALEAMNAKDRRTIHVALRDVEGIATMSVGDGRYRQVVVVPEGCPEYQEAKEYETPRSET